MTALRQQMENDMVLRGMAVRTRQSYLEAVRGLAKFYRKSPDGIAVGEVQSYLLHLLQERGLSHSTCEEQWIPAKRGFLFPVRALSVVFRAKYLEALQQAFEAQKLAFAGEATALAEPSAFRAFFAKLRAKDWVVYAKPPFGGPEAVLSYLGQEPGSYEVQEEPETVEAFLSRVLGTDVNRCPHCGQGRLRPIRALPPLPRATGPPLLRWAA